MNKTENLTPAREQLLKIAKPILFNTEMVRAILDGRKTATRRALKGVDKSDTFLEMTENPYIAATKKDGEEYPKHTEGLYAGFHSDYYPHYPLIKSPYSPGDVLYVRETWVDEKLDYPELDHCYHYKADGEEFYNTDGSRSIIKWRPSIHMPKDAARIFLRVTDVSVERLQDIDDDGAKAEGANYRNGKTIGWEEKIRRSAIERFKEMWNSTIPKKLLAIYGWDANPWVWVIEFKRMEVE